MGIFKVLGTSQARFCTPKIFPPTLWFFLRHFCFFRLTKFRHVSVNNYPLISSLSPCQSSCLLPATLPVHLSSPCVPCACSCHMIHPPPLSPFLHLRGPPSPQRHVPDQRFVVHQLGRDGLAEAGCDMGVGEWWLIEGLLVWQCVPALLHSDTTSSGASRSDAHCVGQQVGHR